MSIKLKGSTAGSVALDAPANTSPSGSDIALTLPIDAGSANQYLKNGSTAGALEFGTLPLEQGPAFRARLSADFSFSASTNVKVEFDTETFDTDSDYDHATNYRFTPSKAGYYAVVINLYSNWDGSQYSYFTTSLYKNGSLYGRSEHVVASGTTDFGNVNHTDLVAMNGSTDYIEAFVNTNAGTPKINDGTETVFSAHWVRGL